MPVISGRQSHSPATAAVVSFPHLPIREGNAKFQLEVSENQEVPFFSCPSSWVPKFHCGALEVVLRDGVSLGMAQVPRRPAEAGGILEKVLDAESLRSGSEFGRLWVTLGKGHCSPGLLGLLLWAPRGEGGWGRCPARGSGPLRAAARSGDVGDAEWAPGSGKEGRPLGARWLSETWACKSLFHVHIIWVRAGVGV